MPRWSLGRMQPPLRARSFLFDRRCRSLSASARRPVRHSAPLQFSMIARPHEVGLVDSWRADSQSRSVARSRNYPMCKTHTSAKCRKNNSPATHRSSSVQYDLTLRYGITPRCFYVRGEYRSFHTTKTQSGHRRVAFAAMHGPDLLYLTSNPWVGG